VIAELRDAGIPCVRSYEGDVYVPEIVIVTDGVRNDSFIEGIRSIVSGRRPLYIAKTLTVRGRGKISSALEPKELRLLDAFLREDGVKAVCYELKIGKSTYHRQMKKLLEKLGLASVGQLRPWANDKLFL